jgi:hypothetical protein
MGLTKASQAFLTLEIDLTAAKLAELGKQG